MARGMAKRLAIAGLLVGAAALLVAARAPVRWVSTVSGVGPGLYDGDAAGARFYHPSGLALDDRDPARPLLYVADTYNHRIRMVDLAAPGGAVVSTVAGNGGLSHSGGGYHDGPGAKASFSFPRDVAFDGQGRLYVADTNNHRIRMVDLRDPARPVTTIAGSTRGLADGPGAEARFHTPWGLACDGTAAVLVADTYNHRIRRVDLRDPAHRVATAAGSTKGYADGAPGRAKFDAPVGVAVDPRLGSHPVYVADASNRCIRRFVPGEAVTTIGGAPRQAGDDELIVDVPLIYPTHVTFDPDGRLYVSDQATNTIYRVGADDGRLEPLAGDPGAPPGKDDGPVAWARFGQPGGLVASARHGLFVADVSNHRLRRLR